VTVPSRAPEDLRTAAEESYRILRSRIDLSGLPRFSRDVTERVVLASADFGYCTDLVCDEESLAAGVAALAAGAPVIADSAMVAAGITGYPVLSKISDAGPGAIWVVGGTPEALQEMLSRRVEPAFVIGLPVGFVGAAEAKDALRASGAACVSNVSEKGGATVAVAAFSALLAAATGADGGQEADRA
jgi:precorrin isomerase